MESVRRFAGLRLSGPLPDETDPGGDAGLGDGVVRPPSHRAVVDEECRGERAGDADDQKKTGLAHSLPRFRTRDAGWVWTSARRGCGVAWQVSIRASVACSRDGAEAAAEKRKASVRAKVELRSCSEAALRVRSVPTGDCEEHAAHPLLLGFSTIADATG